MATKTARLLQQREQTNTDSPMARLLVAKDAKVNSFKKGDKVTGTITKLTRQEILIDLGGKAEALVLERDKRILKTLLESLKEGDEVTVSILSPESDNGNPIVSLRRYVDERVWENLATLQKDRTLIPVTITDMTKGGYVVSMENGTSGFLPQSHILFAQNATVNVGDMINVYVQDLKRQEGKIIFSQKQALSPDEFKLVTEQYPVEKTVTPVVENVTNFGIFVTLPFTGKDNKKQSVDGLIHVSEVAWEKTEDLPSDFAVGDSIEAKVIGFDTDSKRVDLSIKRMSKDPFAALSEKYKVDTKVDGKVVKTVDGNVHIDLGEGVEGVIRKEKVPPTKSFNPGDVITLVVSHVDAKRRKIELSPVLLEKPIGYR